MFAACQRHVTRKRFLNRALKRQFRYWNKECSSLRILDTYKGGVRIGYNADSDPHPDPAFLINVVPELDPDPGF
jgi:hypothetical protein